MSPSMSRDQRSGPRGRYRTMTPESGAEDAYVDYGTGATPSLLSRARYEEEGYFPPFELLPDEAKWLRMKETIDWWRQSQKSSIG